MLKINDPELSSWVDVPQDCDFPIQNIPFGIFTSAEKSPRMATIIGDTVIDLQILAQEGFFNIEGLNKYVFEQMYINDFMALGKPITRAVRSEIANIFSVSNTSLQNNLDLRAKVLHSVREVDLHLPIRIGDYTDFYSSREHATNIGTMFRDPDNALLPNWLHLPVGYHGRASSIVVSGTAIHRPKGQQRPQADKPPVYGPSKLLDFELEVAFVIGKSTKLGETISIENTEDHIFGLVLFNDWSARDIQKWEYVPLGPFLGKSFASTISPWVVTLDALESFRTKGYDQEPEVLPYLKYQGKKNYDIQLEVAIQPESEKEEIICKSNFKHMYWTMGQQLAHHTVNGCNVNVGDICASGTISGPNPEKLWIYAGVVMERHETAKNGNGSQRKFIQDGDTIIMKGFGEIGNIRIGFGEAKGKLLPALS